MAANGSDESPVPTAALGRGIQHRVAECVAYSVSTDGTLALMAMRTPENQQIEIVLPVHNLKHFRSMVNDLVSAADRQNMAPHGQVMLKYPRTAEAGSTSDVRGHVVLRFDDGLVTEQIMLLPWGVASVLAEAMKGVVDQITTPAQRAQLRAVVTTERRIIRPGEV
jgi:hypothetical protein